jgi:hypothetical protein
MEEEAHTFALELPLALISDGLTAPVGWLPDWEAGGPSRTGPSELSVSLQAVGEPAIVVTEHTCGSWAFIPVRAELTTSDGALRASLSGTFYRVLNSVREDDEGWQGHFETNLRDAHGTVDLRMREAWSRIKGRGERKGWLGVSLGLDELGAWGTIGAGVEYEQFANGTVAQSAEGGSPHGPQASAPIQGHFPFGPCSPERGQLRSAEEPLPEAAGKTAGTLVQEAQALLPQLCGTRWQAVWRDGSPTDVSVELSPSPARDLCAGTRHGELRLSWTIMGSAGSEDGGLRVPLSRASAVIQDGVFTAFGVESRRPDGRSAVGYARCDPAAATPDIWSGSFSSPLERGARDCLKFLEPDRCQPL